jgi:hypothetical protein
LLEEIVELLRTVPAVTIPDSRRSPRRTKIIRLSDIPFTYEIGYDFSKIYIFVFLKTGDFMNFGIYNCKDGFLLSFAGIFARLGSRRDTDRSR